MAFTNAYTSSMVAEICSMYNDGIAIGVIAEKYNKPSRSIVALLSRYGVFKPNTKMVAKAAALLKCNYCKTFSFSLKNSCVNCGANDYSKV